MVAQWQTGDDRMLLHRQRRQHGLPVFNAQLLRQLGQSGFGGHHQRARGQPGLPGGPTLANARPI